MVQTECQKPNSRYWDCCGACSGELIDSDGVAPPNIKISAILNQNLRYKCGGAFAAKEINE